MPRHSGSATRKTTTDAKTSREKCAFQCNMKKLPVERKDGRTARQGQPLMQDHNRVRLRFGGGTRISRSMLLKRRDDCCPERSELPDNLFEAHLKESHSVSSSDWLKL